MGTTDVDREISAAVRSLDPAAFTSIHILDRVPAIFDDRAQYAAWRSDLGAELEVDPLCVVVVGSTAVGVSLSPRPDKRFRPYHDDSDVDVAVISPRHFDEAWRWLRALGPLDALKGRPDEADLLGWHRRSLVFDGTIATDRLLPYLPFGAVWQSALGRASRRPPTLDRDVKARIYRDFESLREYHRRNVESLRASLQPEPPPSEPMVATGQEAETQ
ncbi:MAG: hypothetical protein NT132_01805 [Microbacterium sp.]|uniref:hypothetical protein n=1 Tax=Microbacterium sp. TaxID=51671 RepID=UPI00261CF4A0|nr:hypothetical protein [Microbacterium sp.]MCX6501142.1 hypothetical protein [Microbacterium sp.]